MILVSLLWTDAVDLLEAVGIDQLPLGVVNTTGICDLRADGVVVDGIGGFQVDRAYRLTQIAVLTVSTAQVFQGKVLTLNYSQFFFGFRRWLTLNVPSGRP